MRYQAYEIASRELPSVKPSMASRAVHLNQENSQSQRPTASRCRSHAASAQHQARPGGDGPVVAKPSDQSAFVIKVAGDAFCGRGIQAGDLVAVVRCAERRGGFWMQKLSDSMPVLAWVSAGETMRGAFVGWLRHYATSPAALLS